VASGTGTVGLSSAEVAERTAGGQLNDVPRRASRGAAEIVTSNVLTLFNAIVGTLCAIVLIFGQPQDALFGLVIVANTGIGIVQELRAKRTLDRLALVGEEPVRVVRDGVPAQISPDQVVLGEHVLIAAGDSIVVDGEVTASAKLEIDESLLTGEADPVAKKVGDQVFSGSFAVAGSGGFRATKVGRDAYAAQIAAEASRFTLASSQLRAGIDRFLKLITWLIIPVAIILTVSQLLAVHASLADAISGTVAGIVTMIPEGLVLLTSIAFAVGVVRLGARDCLVQELPAIEVLACVDVLCVDKTGTLTEAGMQLDEVRVLRPGAPVRRALAELTALEERPNPTLEAIADGLRRRIRADGKDERGAAHEAAPGQAGGNAPESLRDDAPTPPPRAASEADARTPEQPTDGPPEQDAGNTPPEPDGRTEPKPPGDGAPAPDGVDHADAAWRPVQVVPFSSARKWSGAAFDGAGAWVLGAPDVLLKATDPVRAQAEEVAATGLRVLVAGQVDQALLDDPDGLSGAGSVAPAALIVLRQRLRAQAPEALRYFAAQGVAIKVISGDNAASVGAVAAELGLPGASHPVDARTLPGGTNPQGSGVIPRIPFTPTAPLDNLARSTVGQSPQGRVGFVRERDQDPQGRAGVAGEPGQGPQGRAGAGEPGQGLHERAGVAVERAVEAGSGGSSRRGSAAGAGGIVGLGEADLREMARALEANSVFGRVSPQQKRAFVAALQSAGHTVAMTGDGVNDVLALKDADLGVAMGSGSGATRAVAKVVLLDNNFASLPYVVAEGRRVLGNIERVAALFLTKTVYAILLAVAVAVTGLAGLAGLHGLEFPFLPRHLTLISTLTIGVPAFVLALAPNTERAKPGFVPRVLRFAVPAGTACAAATFVSYMLARLAPSASLVSDRTTATITLFGAAVWVLALVARPYTLWRIALVAVMAGCFLAILATPWARHFFLLNAASARDIGAALAAAAAAAAALTIGQTTARRLRGRGAGGG